MEAGAPSELGPEDPYVVRLDAKGADIVAAKRKAELEATEVEVRLHASSGARSESKKYGLVLFVEFPRRKSEIALTENRKELRPGP